MWTLLAACASDPSEPAPGGETGLVTDAVCDPFAVALGTGVTAYVPLADGDDLTVVHGFQGFNAFHVDIAARTTGPGGSVQVQATVTRLATAEVVVHPGQPESASSVPLLRIDPCTGEFAGVRAIFDTSFPWVTSPGICALDGERLRIDVDVTDLATGEHATDSVEVVARTMLLDPDYDGVSWDCDNCPVDENPDQADEDGDGTGDRCEPTGMPSLR